MKFKKKLNSAFKRSPILGLAAVIGGLAAVALIFYVLPIKYVSTANVFIVQEKLRRNTVATYREFCKSELILNRVNEETGLNLNIEQLQNAVIVSEERNSGMFLIGMKMGNPQHAQQAANALADAFCEQENGPRLLALKSAVVVNRAYLPSEPQLPSFVLVASIGALIGFLCCSLIIAVLDYYDDSINSSEQLAHLYGKPVLGSIPHSDHKD